MLIIKLVALEKRRAKIKGKMNNTLNTCQHSSLHNNYLEVKSSIVYVYLLIIGFLSCSTEPAAHEELAEMSDGEDDENGDEEGDVEYSVSESSDKKEKKVGSKAKWSQQMVDDTVDIIISSNQYNKKLIFTITKTKEWTDLC